MRGGIRLAIYGFHRALLGRRMGRVFAILRLLFLLIRLLRVGGFIVSIKSAFPLPAKTGEDRQMERVPRRGKVFTMS
jgi:hypothetical protein